MNRSSIPNLISIFRIFLAIPLVIMIFNENYGWALVILAIAGLSDGVDGFLARHFHWESRLGAILDPIGDKVLMVSSFVTLGIMGKLGVWLVLLVILRDVVIVAGAVAYHYLVGRVEMEPTFISKANTLFQIVLILAVLISLGPYPLPSFVIESLILIVIFTTLYSGINYVWIWSKRATLNGR